MPEIVHIIDVESGNLRSLQNAVEYLGYETKLIKDASDPELSKATKLFLPGVGSYGHFVRQLNAKGFVKPVKEYIAQGKPIMVFVLDYKLYLMVLKKVLMILV